jgi:hypothetical protein
MPGSLVPALPEQIRTACGPPRPIHARRTLDLAGDGRARWMVAPPARAGGQNPAYRPSFLADALVAQRKAHWITDPGVGGSNPSGGTLQI